MDEIGYTVYELCDGIVGNESSFGPNDISDALDYFDALVIDNYNIRPITDITVHFNDVLEDRVIAEVHIQGSGE